MASKTKWITMRFGGGWATDFGPRAYNAPDAAMNYTIPWLNDAFDVVYEFDGGPHKCPGTAALNSTTLGGSSSVRGVFDYWRQGTGGAPSQRIVAHVDTRVLDVTGGSTTVLATGLSDSGIPHYDTFDDFLIIGSDSSSDVPRSWDQTTFQNLAGSPPRFSFSTNWKSRQFAAGVYTAPSTLYYSPSADPEDWTGAGSGSITVSPNDGDMIVGIISHKNELIIFKGPYKGSIHRLQGSTPSDFAVVPFIKGIPAVWQNSIFRFGDDVGWLSPFGTVHSLNATDKFGNYVQSYLTYPIGSHVRENMNHGRLRQAWAVDVPNRGYVLITYPDAGQTNNNRCLMMDYRWLPQGEPFPRWAMWKSFQFASLGLVVDASNRQRLFGGDYSGFVYKTDQPTRTHASAAITATVTTPSLTFGDELTMKTLERAAVGVRPYNNNSLAFRWQRDNQTQQSYSGLTQGGGDVLGSAASNQFTLDTSQLAGANFIPRFMELEEGGEFRAVSFQVEDSTNNSDLELHTIGAGVSVGAASTEN